MRRRGFTLLELLVAVLVGLTLMATLALALQRGSRAFLYAEQRNSLTGTLQEASRKLKRELEGTHLPALELGAGVLSFASPYGLTGTPEQTVYAYLPSGRPCWRKRVIVYQEGTALWRRELPIDPAEQANPGPAPTPLVDYKTGGSRWVPGITGFSPSLDGSSLTMALTASQQDPEPRTAALNVTVDPRN